VGKNYVTHSCSMLMMVVCAADPCILLPGEPGRCYIDHQTGVCEGGKRKYCVTHSRSVFRMEGSV